MKEMPAHTNAQAGDQALLVSAQNKRFIICLSAGARLETHRGYLNHDDLINQPWGSRVYSHLGSPFTLLQPSLADILLEIKRNTQIMYPKDIGYILVTMGIGPGGIVLEAGTGSGALTTALAFMVGEYGHVYSYEKNPAFSETAQQNLKKYGLAQRVTFKCRDIAEGIDETGIPAVFLDLPDPENYIAIVREVLIPGGYLGCFLPTTNQVSLLLTALKQHNFEYVEVSEILHRYYKATATRLRPMDKMVAHTGYLIFARKFAPHTSLEPAAPEPWTPLP